MGYILGIRLRTTLYTLYIIYIALKDSGDFSKIVGISLKSGNFFTCNNVSDRFDEGSKSRDVRQAVLPHWLPYYQTTSQSEGQV